MFCSKCGSKLDSTAKFCDSCGTPVQNVSQTPINNVTYNSNNTGGNISSIIKGCIIASLVLVIIILAGIIVVNGFNNAGNNSILEGGSHSRTIMIYMVGSNLETDGKIATVDLESIKPSEVDLTNVNVLLYTGGTEKWHNFVSSDENAIYKLTSNGFEKIQTYNKENMGDSETLETFLDYSYENFKTDRYDLIFYNHGGAIDGAIYDDFSNDNLSVLEFKKALADSNFNKNNKLEVVLFRTCLNGTLEVANAFKDYAYYLVASEEVTNGGNTSSVLNFINDIESTDTPIDYGKKFINAYDEQMQVLDPYGIGTDPMYAIIDLTKVDKVNEELDRFINGIDLTNNYSDIVRVRSSLFQYAFNYYGYTDYDMVDLYTMVDKIDDYSTTSSTNLLTAINDAVVYNWTSIEESHGLSIFFPYKASASVQNYMISKYNDFDFSSSYTKFIKQFYNLSTSKKSSSFTKTNIMQSDTSVTKGEFKLELTGDQVKDYAESVYIVFEKQDDYFMPIYSSDNTKLEGNTLKTSITNNLLKIVDHSEGGSAYIQLFERSKGGTKNYSTTAILQDFTDISNWKMDSVTLRIDYKDNKPYIASAIAKDEKAPSGRSVSLDDYTTMDITNFRYKVLDENGKYTGDWEGDPTKYLFELSLDSDYELVNASLDDGDYYCVFIVYDIYGNHFYSNLKSIKE